MFGTAFIKKITAYELIKYHNFILEWIELNNSICILFTLTLVTSAKLAGNEFLRLLQFSWTCITIWVFC